MPTISSALIASAAIIVATVALLAQAGDLTTRRGVYTETQAAQGESNAKATCASCHAADYLGGSLVTSLLGESFVQMLGEQEHIDISAFLLTRTVCLPAPHDAQRRSGV